MHLGIDIGTYFSRITYEENGKVSFVNDPVGEASDIPTSLYVGKDAQAAFGVSADMRRHNRSGTYYNQFKARLMNDDTSEYNASALLKQFMQLLRDISPHGRSDAVIAVPANYAEFMLRRIEHLAHETGFEHVMLVSEPIAAVTAYVRKEPLELGEYVLVIDCGGSVSKVALVTQTSNDTKIIAHTEEKGAGIAFDREIFAYVQQQLNDDMKQIIHQNPTTEIQEVIAEQCHKLKKQLNKISEAYVRFSLPNTPDFIDLSLDSDTFYRLITSHVKTIAHACESLIGLSKVERSQIRGILGCGASLRSPQLQQALTRYMNLPLLSTEFDPGVLIAAGLALTRPLVSGKNDGDYTSNPSPKSSRDRQPGNYAIRDNPFEDFE